MCDAVKAGLGALMTDFSEDPDWLLEPRSHDEWLASLGDIPGIAYIPGFHLGLIIIDAMHVLHLGVLLCALLVLGNGQHPPDIF